MKRKSLQDMYSSMLGEDASEESNITYSDLASLVASELDNEYGSHNYEPFIKELASKLLEKRIGRPEYKIFLNKVINLK